VKTFSATYLGFERRQMTRQQLEADQSFAYNNDIHETVIAISKSICCKVRGPERLSGS